MKLLVILVFVGLVFGDDDDKNAATKNVICDTCKCDKTTKTVDCSGRKITKLFTRDEWLALNASGTIMDNVRFDINQITNITAFPTIKIKFLSLKQNDIVTIVPSAFKNLTDLEELDLSFNQLTADALVPEIFEGKYDPETYEPLKRLRVLKLGNNNLHSLDSDLFEHLPNLESLSLDSNPFMVIDFMTTVAISTIPRLKNLDLSYMELKELPEHIFHRPRQLESLNLTGNLFSKVPEALIYGINLKFLSLDENPIVAFNETNQIPSLPKLEILSLSYITPLKALGNGSIGLMPELHTFMCTNNPHLSEIQPNALSLPGQEDAHRREWPVIRHLYLHDNNLSRIDANLLGRWDELEVADIRYNPWHCDCNNQWMIATLMPIIIKNTPQIAGFNKCKTPVQMANISLVSLTKKESEMRCDDAYQNHPEKDGAILVGILVGLLIGIPISFSLVIMYKRGCFGVFRSTGPADYSRAFYKRAHMQEDFHI